MRFLLLLLAPLLVLQGKRVRARTVRLPEAEGERSGIAGKLNAPPLRILVVGDSAAAGVGCRSQNEAVTGQWVSLLSASHRVQWQLIAKSSLTCAGVFELLKSTPTAFEQIDMVLISVGVNDVTRRTSIAQWCQDLNAMTHYLKHSLAAKTIIYTALPPMHKFPALPQPLRSFVGSQAKRLNKSLQHHCAHNTNTHFLAFDVPFTPEYMASDGYHPSPKAAALWASSASLFVL